MPRRHQNGPEENYRYFMKLSETDPERAGQEFLQYLQKGKPTAQSRRTIMDLERILQGDINARQFGSEDIGQAIQFLISNTLMKGMGLGVQRPGMEGLVANIANMISEDTHFVLPMTTQQKSMKQIAESYGFTVIITENMRHNMR